MDVLNLDMYLRTFLISVILQAFGAIPGHGQDQDPWSRLLQKHVDARGMVDYSSMVGEGAQLEKYLEELAGNEPSADSRSSIRLAYYINLYNAATIQLVIRNYPLNSITDLNEPWKLKFIRLGDEMISLDYLEHEIIRTEFREPRIHFALVCAAMSCPKLRNEAYVAERLEEQLDDQARTFLNDPKKNRINPGSAKVSMIFQWFKEDFTTKGSLVEFLQPFTEVTIRPDADISYMEYDWALNKK